MITGTEISVDNEEQEIYEQTKHIVFMIKGLRTLCTANDVSLNFHGIHQKDGAYEESNDA